MRHVPLPLLAVIMAAILFAELARCEREGAKETAAEAEKSVPRRAALTFDDGPNACYTPEVLEILKENEIPATFFLQGQCLAGNEEIVRRMHAEGHLIGNHGYRHIQMTKEEAEQACADIEQTEKLIQSITGKRPEYLRPPYGDWNEQLECRVNLTTVLWNVDSLDWKFQNTDRIVRRVEKDVKDGDIILMHDLTEHSVSAALSFIDTMYAKGYEFCTVSELAALSGETLSPGTYYNRFPH